jgi:hypothetical protein
VRLSEGSTLKVSMLRTKKKKERSWGATHGAQNNLPNWACWRRECCGTFPSVYALPLLLRLGKRGVGGSRQTQSNGTSGFGGGVLLISERRRLGFHQPGSGRVRADCSKGGRRLGRANRVAALGGSHPEPGRCRGGRRLGGRAKTRRKAGAMAVLEDRSVG